MIEYDWWLGYFGLEFLNNPTAEQREPLITELKRRLGPADDGRQNPADLLSILRRLNAQGQPDNEAAIFKARFNKDHLTIAKMKNWLADVYGVLVGNISDSRTNSQYGPVITFSYGGKTRLRVILFGGIDSTELESATYCRMFKADNRDQWERLIEG